MYYGMAILFGSRRAAGPGSAASACSPEAGGGAGQALQLGQEEEEIHITECIRGQEPIRDREPIRDQEPTRELKKQFHFLSFCILHIIPSSFSGRSPTPFTGFRALPGDILAWLHPLLTAPAAGVGSAALPQGDIPVTQPVALPTARDGHHGANPALCPRAGPGTWDAGGDECAHGVFPAKLAEADNSLLPKGNLSSVRALWNGHGPAWNRQVWGWEWQWEAEGLKDM